jgi:hypothetical protein
MFVFVLNAAMNKNKKIGNIGNKTKNLSAL